MSNVSWKLGRKLHLFRTTEVSVTDFFGGDLDLQAAIMDEDNQGMIYSMQFTLLIYFRTKSQFSMGKHVPL